MSTTETKPSVTLPDSDRKPKTTPMRFLKLGEAKDPEFGKAYFLFGNKGTKESPLPDFQVGALAGINSSEFGKKYSWFIEGQEDERNKWQST